MTDKKTPRRVGGRPLPPDSHDRPKRTAGTHIMGQRLGNRPPPASHDAESPGRQGASTQPRLGLGAPVVLAAAFAAMLMVIYGIVMLRGGSSGEGATALLCGMLLFLVASKYLSAVTWSSPEVTALAEYWLPASILLIGFLLSAVAVYEIAQPRTPLAMALSTGFWAASVICFAVGVVWLDRWVLSASHLLTRARTAYPELLLVLGLVAVAFGVRLYALGHFPYPWSGDEATVGMAAQEIIRSHTVDIFNAGWSGNPFPAFYLTVVSVYVLGGSILAVRVASALVGALTVLFLYLLAKELFDRRTALIAAGFLITFPVHLQFSRVGVLTVQDGFFVTFVLWLVIRAVRKDRLAPYLWAGIATGVTLYAYVGGRLVLALAFAALAFVVARRPGFFRSHLRHLGTFLAATVLTVAPMAVFFMQHLQDFNSRFSQVSIIQSGWLAAQLATTGRSLGAILMDQVTRSTLVYIAQPAYAGFFNSPEPYLTFVGSLLFLIGMGVAFQRLRDVPFTLLLTWFWSVVMIGGVLTIGPPANTRMIMTAPAVALFLALGLAKLMDLLAYVRVPDLWQSRLSAVIVVALVVQNGFFYFGPYRAGYYFDDANAEVAMQVGKELQALGPKYTLCMMGLPRMFSGFPTIPFLAPNNPRIDLDPANIAAADLKGYVPALIVATPDNLPSLLELSKRYPGGTWESVQSKMLREVLYFAYVLPGLTAAATP
jgi:4-amino-4-deoxy-L-arabinose transferase-like glycosyltransferase